MQIPRIAAFPFGNSGGNAAGVALCERLPERDVMQRIAAEIGFSETALVASDDRHYRSRYFAPVAAR